MWTREMLQLLARISQQLEASANGSTFPVPLPASFRPTAASVVCNALWFISLGLSLTCALIAMLLDQWARDFLHRSEIHSALFIRARIFSYLYYGLKRFSMHTVVEIIPLLLHASLFLFFSGLVAFLIPVNITMTIIAAIILVFVTATYSALTIFPLRYFDCPYRTPLSGGFWRLLQSYQRIRAQSTTESVLLPDETMAESMARRAVEESDERESRDGRALVWTVKSLSDDSELEPFVEGIPDVLWGSPARSEYILGPLVPSSQRYSYADHIRVLVNDPDVRLCDRIENYMRSCDMGLLSSEARKRRLIASYRALWAITTLFNTKQFPAQPPLDFSCWTRFFDFRDDSPDILHYSLSAQALFRWSSMKAGESRMTEFSEYLAKCRTDIEHGIEPDQRPITLFVADFPWPHPLSLGIPPAVTEGELTNNLVSAMQSHIDTVECNLRFNYVERAARLDSEPYLWRETLELLERPSFNFSKCQWRLEEAINRVVQNLIHKGNTEKPHRHWHWTDQIVHDLIRLWTPISSTVIPLGIIRYLNKRTSANLWPWSLGLDSWVPRFLFCFPVTLSTITTAKSNSPTEVTEDQLLVALWRAASGFAFLNIDWSVHSSVLEALANLGFSGLSISVNLLVKAQLYRSLGWATADEDWVSRFNHPLLPTETAVAAPPDSVVVGQDNNISSLQMIMGIRITEGMVCLVAEFLELCSSDPFPYNAVQTLQEIGRYLQPTSVHEVHQNRLAQAINKLFESPHGAENLPSVVNQPMFEAYVDESEMDSWGPYLPWLTSSDARNTIKVTFSAYTETLPSDSSSDSQSASLLRRLRQIIERLDLLHPDIKLAPFTAGSFGLYFLRNEMLILSQISKRLRMPIPVVRHRLKKGEYKVSVPPDVLPVSFLMPSNLCVKDCFE